MIRLAMALAAAVLGLVFSPPPIDAKTSARNEAVQH
jgi:hypothetical protein